MRSPVLLYNHGTLVGREHLYSQILPVIPGLAERFGVVLATPDTHEAFERCSLATKLGLTRLRRFWYEPLPSGTAAQSARLVSILRRHSIRRVFACTPSQALLLATVRPAVGGLHVSYWHQGLEPEEGASIGRSRTFVAAKHALEISALLASNSVLVVSAHMREHFRRKYPWTRVADKCVISPNIVCQFPDLDAIARVPFSIVYIGALGRWNRFDYIVSLFDAIARREPRATFGVLTTRLDEARRIIGNARVARIEVARVAPDELPAAAARYQYGIIIRDPVALNQVASPIKVGEYWAAGLRVIATRSVGDYSEWIVKHGLGTIVDGVHCERDADAVVAAMRSGSGRSPREIQSFVCEHLSPDRRVAQIAECIGRA